MEEAKPPEPKVDADGKVESTGDLLQDLLNAQKRLKSGKTQAVKEPPKQVIEDPNDAFANAIKNASSSLKPVGSRNNSRAGSRAASPHESPKVEVTNDDDMKGPNKDFNDSFGTDPDAS